MNVVYSGNNSGGVWWIPDSYRGALEQAGWNVSTQGGGVTDAWKEYPDDANPRDGMEEFVRITGIEPNEQGCECCGPPHSFSRRMGEEWEILYWIE